MATAMRAGWKRHLKCYNALIIKAVCGNMPRAKATVNLPAFVTGPQSKMFIYLFLGFPCFPPPFTKAD